MRIRKGKVPLPLSLLSPIPLSDPHLFSRSPVMVVQGNGANTSTAAPADSTSLIINYDHHHYSTHHYSQPSDHLTRTYSNTSATSDLHRLIVDNSTAADVMEFEGVRVRTSNDDASNPNLSKTKGGAAPAENNKNNNALPSLSLSNNEGRWCDGDKAIPLKKRRGISFNNFVENSSTKVLMKCDIENGMNEEQEERKEASHNNNGNNGNTNASVVVTSAKKGNTKRGNTIMEGSRCSRVNGRGWRCCQPTLVGYSLCEHHLGKGRLRSMTSSSTNVKSRSAKKKSSNNSNTLGRDERETQTLQHNEKKHETMSSKRAKLGVVKARSLSSLLGQTNTVNIAGDHASMQQPEQINNLDYY